ncbi:MAG: amidohydrolase family protein [Planctomycetota bacterium]
MTQPLVDIHAHLAGFGDGSPCRVSERMSRSLVFRVLKWKLGLKEGTGADLKYAATLASMASEAGVEAVALGMDAVVDAQGREDWNRTHLYVPAEHVFAMCREHPSLLPGVSLNPLRRDAVDRLENYAEQGAVLVKWLPNLQQFNPADMRCLPFYKALSRLGIPLLAHTGCEHTFPDMDQTLGMAELYERALEEGVTVVMSHCGAACPLHRHADARKGILRLMARHANLMADTSALSSLLKFRHLTGLADFPFPERLVQGSDYPIPGFAMPYAPRIGWSRAFRFELMANPIDKDLKVKEALNVLQATRERSGSVIAKGLQRWREKNRVPEKFSVPN